MLKLLLSLVLISAGLAKPKLLHRVSAPVAVVAPVATSQQSRHDIINPGLITISAVHAAPAVRVASASTSHLDIRQPVAAAVPVAVGDYGGGLSASYAGGLGGGSGGGLRGSTFGGIGAGAVGGLGDGIGGLGSLGGAGLGGGIGGLGSLGGAGLGLVGSGRLGLGGYGY